MEACNVANLFSHLNDIQSSPECCPPGGCVSGFPGTADACSVDCGESAPNALVLHCHSPAGAALGGRLPDRVCVLGKPGRVYEPFWDECGGALTAMGMGGMDEMGVFVSRSVAICVFF